jgi:hypothetical protein
VSFIGGVRGGAVGGRLGSLSGSAALSRRLNPYYENYTLCPYGSAPGTRRSVTGLTLEIRYAPPGP